MRLRNCFITRVLFVAALTSLITCVSITHAQQTSQKKPANQDEDVLRIKTELVQTDVTVFDKRGRFVEGLRPEQFELTVDGKRQPVTFFERITSGSASEATRWPAGHPVPPARQFRTAAGSSFARAKLFRVHRQRIVE